LESLKNKEEEMENKNGKKKSYMNSESFKNHLKKKE
jgi:hypothetical protein